MEPKEMYRATTVTWTIKKYVVGALNKERVTYVWHSNEGGYCTAYEMRNTDTRQWFDTFNEARNWLLRQTDAQCKVLKERLRVVEQATIKLVLQETPDERE